VPELGKLPSILSFLGTRLAVRRVDGAVMSQAVPHGMYPILLHELVTSANQVTK
jgi:hypothetical protein